MKVDIPLNKETKWNHSLSKTFSSLLPTHSLGFYDLLSLSLYNLLSLGFYDLTLQYSLIIFSFSQYSFFHSTPLFLAFSPPLSFSCCLSFSLFFILFFCLSPSDLFSYSLFTPSVFVIPLLIPPPFKKIFFNHLSLFSIFDLFFLGLLTSPFSLSFTFFCPLLFSCLHVYPP